MRVDIDSKLLIFQSSPSFKSHPWQVSYRMENRTRDEKYGVPERDAPIDTRELADKV